MQGPGTVQIETPTALASGSGHAAAGAGFAAIVVANVALLHRIGVEGR